MSSYADIEKLKTVLNEKYAEHKLVGMTLASSIDYLIDFDETLFREWSLKYNVDEQKRYTNGISTRGDFILFVRDIIKSGKGIDYPLWSYQLCKDIEEHFSVTYGIGGTGAQGAAALAKIGFPVALHLTNFSHKLKSLFNSDNVLVSSDDSFVSIMKKVTSEEDDYAPHFIIQYNQGDCLDIDGHITRAENTNRIILTYDKNNNITPIDQQYFDLLNQHAKDLSSVVISGLNTISETSVIQSRIETIISNIKKIKKSNSSVVTYLEGASYHVDNFISTVYDEFSENVDIMAFNEDELLELLGVNNVYIDVNDHEHTISHIKKVIDLYKPGYGVVYHTKYYSMYCGKRLPFDIQNGLTFGNLMAATKAAQSDYGTVKEIFEIATFPLSQKGVALCEKFNDDQTFEHVVAVPSWQLKNQISTIGLGDTFTAGVQLSFI